MRRHAIPAVGLLGLLLTGCIQCEQVITLNPDGSGKSAVTLVTPLNPLEQAFSGGGPQGGKKLTLADKKRRFVDKLLSGTIGVEAWKDVSAEFTPEGLLKFQGTAYFKDMQQFKMESIGGLPVKLERQRDGSLRLVLNPENLQRDVNKPRDKEEPADLKKLSDKELDEYILTKRVEFQGAKALAIAMLTDLKIKNVFHLPGDVTDVRGYKVEGQRALSLTIDGNKILKGLNELMRRDNAFFRKELRAGNILVDFSGDSAKLLKAFGLDWYDASAVVKRPAGPQFDYAKEVAAARAAYPALRQRLGLEEEKKAPDFPEFKK
jgi:hypothetical protein